MSSFDDVVDSAEKKSNNDRVLADITSASASASASASTSVQTTEGHIRGQVTTLLTSSKPNDTDAVDQAVIPGTRSSSTDSDDTPVSAESDGVENENPILMSDISRMMETMHSKNLMLKKLVRMQQTRLELLKNENDELRRDGKRKDARLRNADVTIEYLQREVDEQRNMLQRKTGSKQVTIEEHTPVTPMNNINKRQRNDSTNLDKDDKCDDTRTANTGSLRRSSMSARRKRCNPLSVRGAMERLARRINTMRSNRRGVTLCICTLGGAIVIKSMLHVLNRNGDYSDS